MLSTRINHEGQVTIPVEIRNELNLQEGDVPMVEQLNGKVVLTNPQDIVRRTAGALAKYAKNPPPTPEEMRRKLPHPWRPNVVSAFVDTNVLLRHLFQDHEDHSPRASQLINDIAVGNLTAYISETVVFEYHFYIDQL